MSQNQTFRVKIATNLLVAKNQGISYHRYFKGNWKWYLTGILYMTASCALFYYIGVPWLSFISCGFYIGALVRDIGWIRNTKKQWAIQQDFIDWAQVERAVSLADLDDSKESAKVISEATKLIGALGKSDRTP